MFFVVVFEKGSHVAQASLQLSMDPTMTITSDPPGSPSSAKITTMPSSQKGGACVSSQHLEGRGRGISEFEANLVYRASSRTARATQRNPVLKNKTNQHPRLKQQNTETVATPGGTPSGSTTPAFYYLFFETGPQILCTCVRL